MIEILGTIGVFGYVCLVALFLLWFLLPIAVFGIKERLDDQIEEQKKTNQLLANLLKEMDKKKLLPDESKPVFADSADQSTFNSQNDMGTINWKCDKCGENCEGQFSECWQCGTSRPIGSINGWNAPI